MIQVSYIINGYILHIETIRSFVATPSNNGQHWPSINPRTVVSCKVSDSNPRPSGYCGYIILTGITHHRTAYARSSPYSGITLEILHLAVQNLPYIKQFNGNSTAIELAKLGSQLLSLIHDNYQLFFTIFQHARQFIFHQCGHGFHRPSLDIAHLLDDLLLFLMRISYG